MLVISDLSPDEIPAAIAIWKEAGLLRLWNDPRADAALALRHAGSTILAARREAKLVATVMVRDHTAVNQKALALVKKLKVKPEDNPTSKSLSQQAQGTLASLKKLNGPAFDKAYADNEVEYHKTVNGALESTLIPSADNPELKQLLETGLKIFQGHQQHAEQVAKSL